MVPTHRIASTRRRALIDRALFCLLLSLLWTLGACQDDDCAGDDCADTRRDEPDIVQPPTEWSLELERLAPDTPTFADCLYAGPLLYSPDNGDPRVIIVGGDVVVSMDPNTAAVDWVVELPEPEGERAFATAPPALVGDRLLVSYQTLAIDEDVNVLDPSATGHDAAYPREAHWAVVVDLANGRLDPDFEQVELQGAVTSPNNGENVPFLPQNAFGRAALNWAGATDTSLGKGYVTFGNVRDIQPWHGWVFELDFDAWRDGDASDAISSILCTTPEADCGTPGTSGSTERICGGGLWAPSGQLTVGDGEDFSLILAPGNGQLDLERSDFANTLMKTGPGLSFEHGCDMALCADFDPDSPSRECIESCQNLFIPRPLVGEADPAPESGLCEGLAFFECWQLLDYIGGSTPTYVDLGEHQVLIYPTKDGHAYLVDYNHLGTLYDREQLVDYCGTEDDPCRASWAGMAVTQPEVVDVDGEKIALIPTFMFDQTHAAGVVALKLTVQDGAPIFERLWEFPNFETDAAFARFREHSGRLEISDIEGEPVAWIVEATTHLLIDAKVGGHPSGHRGDGQGNEDDETGTTMDERRQALGPSV